MSDEEKNPIREEFDRQRSPGNAIGVLAVIAAPILFVVSAVRLFAISSDSDLGDFAHALAWGMLALSAYVSVSLYAKFLK